MSKHTPGPLAVQATDRSIETVNEAGEVVFSRDWPAYTSSDRTVDDVLECSRFTGNAETRDELSQANKRALSDEILRAAAPELLEALEFLLYGAEKSVRNGLIQPQVHGGIVLARAAITKATGE